MEEKQKKFIVLGSIGFIILVVFLFLFSNSLVVISSEDKGSLTAQHVGTSSPEDISAGFHILRKGQYEFNKTQGISSTKKFVSLKPFIINKVSMNTEPQSSAKKIARGAEDCVFGSSQSFEVGVVGSYKCIEPATIFQNKYETFSEKSVLVSGEEFTLGSPLPYRNSLITISSGEGGNSLLHIAGRDSKGRPLSDITETTNDPKTYKLAVENDKIFLLDTTKNNLFVLDSPSGVARKVSLNIAEKSLSANARLVVFASKIYLVNPVDVQDDEHKDSFEKGSLYVFSEGQANPEKKISLGPAVENLLNFSVLNSDTIFGVSINQEVSIYNISGKLKKIDTVTGASSVVSADNKVYILINNAIYKYDLGSRSLGLVFGSSNVDVSFITAIHNKLIFSGSANSETESANQTYMLQASSIDSNAEWREEDVLPFGDALGLPISWMDYFENRIIVTLDLASLQKNLSGDGYIFDQKEFEEKSRGILDEFSKRGVGREKYQINIKPY